MREFDGAFSVVTSSKGKVAPPMKSIVVFDPDARTAEKIERILTPEGYRVETIAEASTALSIVRCSSPDLVIVDVDDEAGIGLGLIRATRLRSPRVPVVAIGRVRDADDVLHRALRLGASDTVLKPVSQNRLLRRVAMLAPMPKPMPRSTVLRRFPALESSKGILGDSDAPNAN